MNRRHFIKGLGASLVLFQTTVSSQSTQLFARSVNQTNKKIVWVMLRGAMDSLHAVVPTHDPMLMKLRPNLYKSIKGQLLPLSQSYGLHPKLTHLHALFTSNQMSPIIAVGSGYPKRSHFDGQDFLESGTGEVSTDDGWLARAMEIKQKQGLAVSRSTPVSLRGSDNSSTWYPSSLKEAPSDIYEQLKTLYADDAMLLQSLEEGVMVQNMAGMSNSKRKGRFKELAKSCGQLMHNNNKIDCAMLEMGGWDTHNNQHVRLAKQFEQLDDGIHELKKALDSTWEDTVVIVGTEFGRTVRENGTGGTDHGTASAMFMAGGALKDIGDTLNAGQVLGKWPGLNDDNLFKQRDLQATSNSYRWIAEILQNHWGLSRAQISSVFPQLG